NRKGFREGKGGGTGGPRNNKKKKHRDVRECLRIGAYMLETRGPMGQAHARSQLLSASFRSNWRIVEKTSMPWSFFFQAEDGIRDWSVTRVQTCALPIYERHHRVHLPPGGSPVPPRPVRLLRGDDRGPVLRGLAGVPRNRRHHAGRHAAEDGVVKFPGLG